MREGEKKIEIMFIFCDFADSYIFIQIFFFPDATPAKTRSQRTASYAHL